MVGESEVCVGFAYGVIWHTQRLASIYWVIFIPFGQLMYYVGIWLGEETNNVVEYSVVIKLLYDSLSHGISHV
jgi:hypothetical protein